MPLIINKKPRVLFRSIPAIVHSAGGAKITDIDISSAGITDISKVVERLKGFTWNTNDTVANAGIKIINNGLMKIYTNTAFPSTIYVNLEIKEARSKVQRGNTGIITSSNGYSQTDITISNIKNMARARVHNNGGYFPASPTANSSYNLHPSFWLMNETTLRERLSEANTGGVSMNTFWAVEY